MSSHPFHLIASDTDAGECERDQVAWELDHALLNLTPESAFTFLQKRGEGLRAILADFIAPLLTED